MVGIDLLVIFALAAWVTKVVTTHRVEHEYAKRGETPPRVQLQIDRFKAGERATEPARPGARGYLSELWHDCWDDMTERHRRIRAERKAAKSSPDATERPPSKSRRVRDVLAGWWRWLLTPLGEDTGQQSSPPAPESSSPQSTAVPPAAHPACHVDNSQEPPMHNVQYLPDPPGHSQPPPKHTQMSVRVATNPRRQVAMDEVATNEAARREFAALQQAAEKAADALAALEAARNEMASHAAALADGVSGKRFDSGATTAAVDAAATINSGTLADWSERVDTVAEQAAAGYASLDKYRDGEDLIRQQNVDASTMDSAAA